MTVMLMKAHEYANGKHEDASQATNFIDQSDIGSWALPYVATAFDLGYVQGKGNGLFDPKGLTTRAEAAQIILKLQVSK